MSYLLLDIDGVLNQESDWQRKFTVNPVNIREFGEAFRDTQPKILLISSWKKGFLSPGNERNANYIKNLERELGRYHLFIRGILRDNPTREASVYAFLRSHPDALCIDDDKKEYPNLSSFECKNQMYFPCSKEGFVKKSFEKERKKKNVPYAAEYPDYGNQY